MEATEADKIGAGLLFWCQESGQVLLLQRRSKNNDRKWGLPGGNLEMGDSSLLETAKREAMEEMGILPAFQVVKEYLTKRGKDKSKHYRVFVCKITAVEKESFSPVLNEEHRDWKWYKLSQLAGMKEELHPVVKKLVKEHNILFNLS